jgi:hypothetical protein
VSVLRGWPPCCTMASIVRRPAGPSAGENRTLPLALVDEAMTLRTSLPTSAKRTTWPASGLSVQLSTRARPLPLTFALTEGWGKPTAWRMRVIGTAPVAVIVQSPAAGWWTST